MPKKKVQHKGKPKHATEESEDVVFRQKVEENTDEEYTTVTDFETNKKYSKRLIESNWSKYESNLSDFDVGGEGNSPPKTDDFISLLKTASSDCSHFQFSSEKHWKNETNSMPSSKIFDLDVNVLSSGLACVPFYERLGLDPNELSPEEKEKFDKAAENSWKTYNSIREKSGKKPEVKSECDSHSLVESLQVKLDLNRYNEQNETSRTQEIGNTSTTEIESCNKSDRKNKEKFFPENDENLEDWLDSVLDD